MKKFLQVVVLILLLGFLIACSNGEGTEEPVTENETETEGNTAGEEEGEDTYPVTYTDAAGNDLTLEEEPERIVSLIPSNTEIIFALEQGEKIVGVTDNDTYPEEVTDLESVGSMEFNVELILSLDPDVVLGHETGVNFAQEAFEQLESADVNVFIVKDTTTVEGTYETIETIGEIIGATEESEQLVADMQAEFEEIEEMTATVPEEDRKSVFYEIAPAPDIFTAGNNTLLDELLQFVHADNAAGDQEGWPGIDPEAIIELNPDVIITTYGDYVDKAKEQVLERDGFAEVEAVRNERVYDVDADTTTRPGPRLVEGAWEIAESVYPELFDEE